MVTIRKFIRRVSEFPDWSILILAGILYFPLTFLGYGSDSDALSVVRSGQIFANSFDYIPSRRPGFFVHEVATFFLNSLGGSLLSNIGTLAMSLVTLFCFMKILRNLRIPNVKLLAVILMVHPFYWVSSSSTMDYIWALGFLMLGFYLLLSNRFTGAGIAIGLAIGSRFTSLIPAIGLLVYGFFTLSRSKRAVCWTALLAILVGFVCYLPALDFAEWHPLTLFSASMGSSSMWTPTLWVGRFVYKNLMFWGIPGFLWLVFMFIKKPTSHTGDNPNNVRKINDLCIGVILGMETLFLFFPIAMDYLIVIIPFVLLLVSRVTLHRRWALWVLLLLILSANFIWLNPAHSTSPNQTSTVIYGFWLDPGHLLQDVAIRLQSLRPFQ